MEYRPFENLVGQINLNGPSLDEPSQESVQEKPSQKAIDVFCREVLADNPEIKGQVITQMRKMADLNLSLPLVHITSEAVKYNDNTVKSSGFLENINQNGLRPRDTNVAAFVQRQNTTELALPDYFAAQPELFIKDLVLILRRYVHHGVRTNKNIYENKNEGEGVPVMILVDGHTNLIKGSDFDDHFILADKVLPDKIIGKIDLDQARDLHSITDIASIASQMLEQVDTYYSGQKMD